MDSDPDIFGFDFEQEYSDGDQGDNDNDAFGGHESDEAADNGNTNPR